MPTSRLTCLEGLPGLGKTTVAVALATQVDSVVLVAENNPSPRDLRTVANLNPTDAALWYLRSEVARSEFATRLMAADPLASIICDKSSLATLAFLYALSRNGTVSRDTYQHVRRYYLTHLRHRLPPDTQTILFTGPVALSLQRRQDKPDRAVRPLWFAEDFLHALQDFYRADATTLCRGPLVIMDVSAGPQDVLVRVAALLGVGPPRPDDRHPTRCVGPTSIEHLSPVFGRYAAAVGSTALGQALGAPFHQHGCAAQPCERQLLLDRHGDVILQRDLWERPAFPSSAHERAPHTHSEGDA